MIMNEHEQLLGRYPGARLLWSGDWSNVLRFPTSGSRLPGSVFPTADGALDVVHHKRNRLGPLLRQLDQYHSSRRRQHRIQQIVLSDGGDHIGDGDRGSADPVVPASERLLSDCADLAPAVARLSL